MTPQRENISEKKLYVNFSIILTGKKGIENIKWRYL